jgi:nitroimidazol reductase NimA-like FMN-containing flavoprotein (pyridoxamine 5'-phosphate oxidase superfamily)
MRREDREVSGPQEIEAILGACDTGHLGLIDNGSPYIVPLHFAAVRDDGRFVVYFHGAPAGRKIDLIGSAGVPAGFEVDRDLAPVDGDDPCHTTAYYESVIGHGWVELVLDDDEKRRALTLLTRKYTPHLDPDFASRPVGFVAVVRLTLPFDRVTAKRNPAPVRPA